MGDPDPDQVSTSYIERQNLTMRMKVGRLTRLLAGFSKKIETRKHALSLNYMYYNFVRNHQTLTRQAGGIHKTPDDPRLDRKNALFCFTTRLSQT